MVTISGTETIQIRLLDDAVDVWRPAQAVALGADPYRVGEQAVPEDEAWEFLPDDEVVTRHRVDGSDSFVAAVGRSGAQPDLRQQADTRR